MRRFEEKRCKHYRNHQGHSLEEGRQGEGYCGLYCAGSM